VVSSQCDQCGAKVAADEQFCPTCGSFIDPMASEPARPERQPVSGGVITVNSDGNYEEFSLEPPPGAPAKVTTGGANEPCPSCGAQNPASNRHCQECGARLQQGPLPTAPRPAVQATAGVRAAVAISGLLFLVIVVALLFNVFNGDPSTTSTTVIASSSTTGSIDQPEAITILKAECDPEGIGSLVCQNLISGEGSEYQVNWEELQAEEGTVTIRLTFDRPMIVSRIDWLNISDPERFKQNWRARGLILDADGSLTEVPHELKDTEGLQRIDYPALNANWIDITIVSGYNSEVVGDNVFPEMAIDEITVWARPAG
jgi:uncharacterized OB-fold protein